ncbi:FAD-dependent monooxygenase [Streptomyces sp. 8N114]|uniref:FAD-dependent monooxygenase n=1 Tax=Streptomyces sp. 8N114 TaxID=3457419 RepID=UPI003FD0C4C8
MAASQSFEVVIAGAGLGGLCAALSLRQRALRVTVAEAAPQLGEIGAGIQTAPNASRILMGLGLRPQLERIRTEPQDQVRRRWADGSIIAQLPLGQRVADEYGAPYWHYHRADLHKVLLDACLDPEGPGPVVQIATGAQIVDVDRRDPNRPAVVAADGRRFTGDVVVGADGIRSAVREASGFEDTLVFSGEMAYRALIPGDLISADPATRFLADRFHSTIWYGPDKHLVHYMIRGGDYLNVVAIVPCSETIEREWSGPATAADLAAEYTDWDDRVPTMLAKAKDEDVSLWAMFRRRRDPAWVDGRVALLGDACHAMLPYQAQGASQAMEDAAVLAEELGQVTREGIDAALVRYVHRRAKHAGMVQDASLRNMHFYHLPDGPEQRERDAKLRGFNGESDVSYDWLWNGSPLADPDNESIHYQFAR